MEVSFKAGTMHKFLPPKKIGSAEIIHDSPSPIDKIRGAMRGMPLDCDVYTRLIVNGRLWMTDAEYEWRTNIMAVSKMTGDILIAGLGIGFIIKPMLCKNGVTSITVIENNHDVVALVGPRFPTVNIIEADARQWIPPKKAFDCIYFDIWADVPNSDDWEDIKQLKRRYRPSLKQGGWISAWCEWEAKR